MPMVNFLFGLGPFSPGQTVDQSTVDKISSRNANIIARMGFQATMHANNGGRKAVLLEAHGQRSDMSILQI